MDAPAGLAPPMSALLNPVVIEVVEGMGSGGGGVAFEVSESLRNMKLVPSTGIQRRLWAMKGAWRPLRRT